MPNATPGMAQLVTASEVAVGDELYVAGGWFGIDDPKLSDRFRVVTEVKEPGDGRHTDGAFMLIPEVLETEPRPLVQWVRPDTLVIVRNA